MLIIFPCSRMQQVDMPMCFYVLIINLVIHAIWNIVRVPWKH